MQSLNETIFGNTEPDPDLLSTMDNGSKDDPDLKGCKESIETKQSQEDDSGDSDWSSASDSQVRYLYLEYSR